MRISPQDSPSPSQFQDSAAISSREMTASASSDTSSNCWDVQGPDFVLVNYRPPGVQMALKNRAMLHTTFESQIS